MRRALQTEILASALKNLKKELAAAESGEKAFLSHYRTLRLHAFQLEFLAKFLRKAHPANLENFERLYLLAKDLEDRLGDFNEIDEMIVYSESHTIRLSEKETAADHFKQQRGKCYTELKTWMKAAGWTGKAAAAGKAAQLLEQLEKVSDEDLRDTAIKKMKKVLDELQDNIDQGAFDPRKKYGFTMNEVEPKVHELRREIRKIPMYAGYLSGVFALTDDYKPLTKAAGRALKNFLPLTKTPLAKSPFAKLPRPVLKKPLLIPRPFFLAVTRYISELGFAKDWAQNIERLREAGLRGEVSFDQLDPSLKDVFGCPEPFNLMVSRLIGEMNKTQIFRHMAEYFEAQA